MLWAHALRPQPQQLQPLSPNWCSWTGENTSRNLLLPLTSEKLSYADWPNRSSFRIVNALIIQTTILPKLGWGTKTSKFEISRKIGTREYQNTKGPKTNLKVAMVDEHKSWLEKGHGQSPGAFFKSPTLVIRSNERNGCRKEHKYVWWQNRPSHQEFAAPSTQHSQFPPLLDNAPILLHWWIEHVLLLPDSKLCYINHSIKM